MRDGHTSTLLGAQAHALGMALGAESSIEGTPDYPHDVEECPIAYCRDCEREIIIDTISVLLRGPNTRGTATEIYNALDDGGWIELRQNKAYHNKH